MKFVSCCELSCCEFLAIVVNFTFDANSYNVFSISVETSSTQKFTLSEQRKAEVLQLNKYPL